MVIALQWLNKCLAKHCTDLSLPLVILTVCRLQHKLLHTQTVVLWQWDTFFCITCFRPVILMTGPCDRTHPGCHSHVPSTGHLLAQLFVHLQLFLRWTMKTWQSLTGTLAKGSWHGSLIRHCWTEFASLTNKLDSILGQSSNVRTRTTVICSLYKHQLSMQYAYLHRTKLEQCNYAIIM